MHHAAAFPGDDLIIKREPIFQKNRINFRKLLVQTQYIASSFMWMLKVKGVERTLILLRIHLLFIK